DNNPLARVDPTGLDSYLYVIQGDKGNSNIGYRWMGTHSMMAIQIPDGRYLSASWEGQWTLKLGVNPQDLSKIYKEGADVFALRAKTTGEQERDMLKRLALSVGKSPKGLIRELENSSEGTNTYNIEGHGYNVIWDNCTTRLWDLLGYAGYGGYKNIVPSPNSLFDLRIKQIGQTTPVWFDVKK
ncbi:MAG: hypothetical protein H7145_23550, partial [Akkermansiaceae bacterium]|nr:hypothetical protein [Armatimonadota bacterium]